MRRTLSLAIGAGSAAAAAIMVAGMASAAPGTAQQAATAHQAARPATAVTNKLITKTQAVRIAEAKVPHSRAIEVESNDRHDRAVWKVTLATPHGRVIVDVDKRTGHATILGHGGSGRSDDATVMTRHSVRTRTASAGTAGWSARDAREHARDRADRDQGDRDRGDRDGHHGQRHGDQREAERGDR